jgi:hypothetical protein
MKIVPLTELSSDEIELLLRDLAETHTHHADASKSRLH